MSWVGGKLTTVFVLVGFAMEGAAVAPSIFFS